MGGLTAVGGFALKGLFALPFLALCILSTGSLNFSIIVEQNLDYLPKSRLVPPLPLTTTGVKGLAAPCYGRMSWSMSGCLLFGIGIPLLHTRCKQLTSAWTFELLV